MIENGKLSDRVRAGSECAPWVIEEIKALEAALSAARERIREMGMVHANFRTMADAMMRKKDSELTATDSVVVHAKDFQTRQRGLMQTQDSYGLFQADNKLEAALKRLDALRATREAK